MPSRVFAVAGSLLFVLAVPASAQAVPTIEPLKPCYVTAGTAKDHDGEAVLVQAQGFTPDSRVALTLDGAPLKGGSDLQVDANGVLQLNEFPAPFVPKRVGTRDFTVTLTEINNPANTVSATAKATALGVDLEPPSAEPSQRIRFSGRGFTADKAVYAHYVRKGKQVKRVRVTRRTGACGNWSVKRPQFPFADPALGNWIVQFDQSKKYRNPAVETPRSVYVRLKINISRQPV
jgi:hypothetical protein